VRSRSTNQAELEYSVALAYSVDMRGLLAEMASMMPPDRVARAIGRDREVEHVVRALQRVGRADIAILWTKLALEEHPAYATAQTLYSLAMMQKDLPAAEHAARERCRIIPGNQCQLALARVLEQENKPSDVVAALQDVASWRGRGDERRAAWFMLCDAHLALGAADDARTCLRLLDGSGLVPPTDGAMARRRDALQDLIKQQVLNEGKRTK
jgi:hypothetical protein